MASTINAKNTSTGLVMTPDSSGQLELQTADTTRMTIDVNGNVGIGTSSPGYKFQVNGTSGTPQMQIQTASGGAFLQFNGYDSANAYCMLGGSSATGGVFGTQSNIPVAFYTNNIERMRIDSSGSIMAGTTTARGRLHLVEMSMGSPVSSNGWTTKAAITLSGNYGGSLTLIDGSGGYNIRCDDFGNDLYIQGGATSGGVAGGVYLNNYATSWSSASDENMKDIIEPITSGLDKVLTLRAVIGKYKNEEEGKRHPFLIAQDVQAVLPEAVSVMNKGSENECLGLSYTDVIPLLVASIKELKAIIDTQAERIAALEAK